MAYYNNIYDPSNQYNQITQRTSPDMPYQGMNLNQYGNANPYMQSFPSLPNYNQSNTQSQPQCQSQGQPQPYMRTPPNLVIRAVTGYEEAMATPIPLDGTICVFLDIPHKKVYTKQLNMNDGSALFDSYSKEIPKQKEEPKEPVEQTNTPEPDFVKREEFNSFKQEMIGLIGNFSQKPTEPQSEQQVKTSRGGSKQ